MLALLTLMSGAALAGPCDPDTPLATGPLSASLHNGDLGNGHRACARDELAVSGAAYALVDAPNFYGHLSGGLVIEGSKALGDELEVFGAVEAFRYETVISAFSTDFMGFGHSSLGASWRFFQTDQTQVAAQARAVLPAPVGLYENAWPFGLDLGFAAQRAMGETFALHGYLGYTTSATVGRGPALPKHSVTGLGGLEWMPLARLGLVLDASAELYADTGLHHFAVGPGLRYAGKESFGLELGGVVPLAGDERAMTAVELRSSWRW